QTIGTGVAGWVAEHREPLLLSGEADPDMFKELVPKERKIHTAVCVPLISRGELLGVLNVNETTGNRTFSEYDLRAMMLFAAHAADLDPRLGQHAAAHERHDDPRGEGAVPLDDRPPGQAPPAPDRGHPLRQPHRGR